MMKRLPYLLILSCMLIQSMFSLLYAAKKTPLLNEDQIYESNIRTVQFYRAGNEMTYPILYLHEQLDLILEFDELMGTYQDPSDFWVGIRHCDADWKTSILMQTEYMDGFSYQRIFDYRPGQNTRIPYFHYWFDFPGEGNKFLRSGNYLLYVYREGDEKDIILSRRFIVADNRITIRPETGRTINISERNKIQTINFDILLNGLEVNDPFQDLQVMILQNGRWDNAKTNMQPMFIQGDKLQYTFNASNEFKGGNEFRFLDIRSTIFHTQKMREVEDRDSLYYIHLYGDEPRTRNRYTYEYDINGNFFIEVQEAPAGDYEADYVLVKFLLKMEEQIRDGEVHLFSRITDWQLKEEFRMVYNTVKKRYETEVLLKQGLYDYQYVVARRNKKGKAVIDETQLEGSHFETENFYTILVYHKGWDDLSYRLIGMKHVNYNDR